MNTKIVRSFRTIALASLALVAALLLVAPISFAQSFRGSIRGTITDAHSLAIPSSKITARNLGTSETREVSSDSEGVYFFLELPTGEYEDFVTGFVVDNGHVWGRPVGVTVAQDGSLLVSDDGSNSLWRISYTGTDSQKSTRQQNLASHGTKTASE